MADRRHESSPEAALRGAVPPQFGEIHIRTRGRLPHWEKEEGLYFVTFHLADALPRTVLAAIAERHRILYAAKGSGANLLPRHKAFLAQYSPKKLEAYFDRGSGACLLANPQVAAAMAAALHFWHGEKYCLVAWCIMPNHVHVICRMLPGYFLGEVVKSWKVHVARVTNRLLGRAGVLWQREYYDRLIRGAGEFDRAVGYVLSNPERAGLLGWKWVWSEGQEALGTAGQETGAPPERDV
ncbi:MAG: transposase [Acidobacteriota bacterium]